MPDIRLFRVGDNKGWGIEFPSGYVHVEWNQAAFYDPFDDRHVSLYGHIGDLKENTSHDLTLMYRKPI